MEPLSKAFNLGRTPVKNPVPGLSPWPRPLPTSSLPTSRKNLAAPILMLISSWVTKECDSGRGPYRLKFTKSG